jgi:hypothetical protein
MAKQYKYETYGSEQELENFLNDPACIGMKPIAIYPTGDFEIVVWWEIEDAYAQA